MNTADLWFRGDSFWPGALWRIPGLEIPRIEAEMRAAWDITTKFVNRWCRYNPERTYAYVEHTPPVRRRCGCGGLVPYKLAQYQPEVIGLIGTTTWIAECRCGGRETVEADPPRLNSRITDTIMRTWRLDRLFVHGTGRLPPTAAIFPRVRSLDCDRARRSECRGHATRAGTQETCGGTVDGGGPAGELRWRDAA